ncbi:MAG TPA: PEGA domain-containing protein [Kofleriaceae bacterium]|nr:PEGA domain-containing protein [Kofleriaceae bacterium]
MKVEGRSLAGSVAAALLLGAQAGPPAHAAPPGLPGARRVAVLSADGGAAGARAAAAVRRALTAEPELAPLEPGALSRALEQELPPGSPVDAALEEAGGHLDSARSALAQFDHPRARRALARAEATLLAAPPDPPVIALMTQVAFTSGLVHLREQNRGLAIDAFRLVHRLAPERPPLDPARYPPEVVSAHEAARRPAGAPARLEVSTTFDGASVLLDGAPVGRTPLSIEIAAGPHVLHVAAPGYGAAGRRVEAAPRDSVQMVIDLRRLPAAERALELRRGLAAAGATDRAGLRAAAREVAALSGLDAVVVVSPGAAGQVAAIYQRDGDRLSLARPVDGEIDELLALLVPAPPPGPGDLFATPVPGERPWYQRPWGMASIGGGALAAIIVTAVLIARDVEPLPRNATQPGFPEMP